jgi:hypothetical protein
MLYTKQGVQSFGFYIEKVLRNNGGGPVHQQQAYACFYFIAMK